MRGDNDKPGIVVMVKKNILFPANLFDVFVHELKNLKPGSLNEKDNETVAFFLKNLEMGKTVQ
jgi:hypothetical protein